MKEIELKPLLKAERLLNACYPIVRPIRFNRENVQIIRAMMSLSRRIEDFICDYIPTATFFDYLESEDDSLVVDAATTKDVVAKIIENYDELYTQIDNSPIVFPEALHNNLLKAIDMLKPLKTEYEAS